MIIAAHAAEGTLQAGHNHGAFGELIERLFDLLPIPETFRTFLSHMVIDTVNIFVLLLLVMTAVYFLSSYIKMDKLHEKLSHLKSIPGFLLAIAVGVLSPFCSCSIIPVLIGLISVGVPVSVCLCYLTASSMINLTAVFSLFAVAGPKFGLVYLAACLIIIVGSSVAFSFLKMDSGVKNYVDEHHHHHEECSTKHGLGSRLKCAFLSTLNVFKKCFVYIVLGVALSSAIMTFFSMDAITRVVDENSFLSTTIAFVIGLPIHSDIFSVAPVLTLLLEISPSVALAFVLPTMALSIPSVVILTRALKTKVVAVYCGVIVAITLAVSYLGVFLL